MSDRVKSLRDRVEAVQALAAKATPGPWSVCPQWGEVLAPSGAFVVAEGDPDAHLMAAAPDLVTLATDLLAAADRLRLRVAELEEKYCNHNVTAILTAGGNNRLRGPA